MVKSKLNPPSGSSLEAVEPHPQKGAIKFYYIYIYIYIYSHVQAYWGILSQIEAYLGIIEAYGAIIKNIQNST